MKKLVIFDLDGTLLDTIADLGEAVNAALGAEGMPTHAPEAYPAMVGNGVRRLVERAMPAELRSDGRIDTVLGRFREYYDDHLWDHTRPYEGIPSLLAELRARGVAVAVASNKYEAAVKRLIAHFFPDIDFAAVCGSVEGVQRKPDPSVVFRILCDVPTPKAEVLYVGDSGVDIETARRACVDCAAVTWGFRPEAELIAGNPGWIVREPTELLSLV